MFIRFATHSTIRSSTAAHGHVELATQAEALAGTDAERAITPATLAGAIADFWAAGNVVYVPLGANIQTYINAASAGDTLVLASGQYVITSTITINKQLNIVGQGNAGFLTAPVTAGHGTLISSTTAGVTAFLITSSNVRIANLSINLTGDTSLGINTGNNLVGLVFTNVDLIITCAGWAAGFTVNNSDVVMRDLSFYITSSNSGATGVVFLNDAAATGNNVADCFNVTGVVKGAAVNAFCYLCTNGNVARTITLNMSNSVCKSLTGTPLDVAVAVTSTVTNNAVVNAYMCNFDGADWDAYQTGTNQLNVGGSVLANNRVSGTITYRTTMAAGSGVFSTGLRATLPVHVNNAAALLAGLVAGDFYRTNADPDPVCVVH